MNFLVFFLLIAVGVHYKSVIIFRLMIFKILTPVFRGIWFSLKASKKSYQQTFHLCEITDISKLCVNINADIPVDTKLPFLHYINQPNLIHFQSMEFPHLQLSLF